jgi:hypothetical protein
VPVFNSQIKARVMLNSSHASLEHDVCQLFQHLGMTVANGNMDRSYEERPCIPGYSGFDFGEEVRTRMNSLTCEERDFDGCDMIMFFNPSDFHHRIAHFAKFRPVVMYLVGQWLDKQLDEMCGAINGQVDRKEQPRIWVACYSKREENYLRPRIYKELQDRVHHIRFAKKLEDYCPWSLDGSKAPERSEFIYTTCNDIHRRAESCVFHEWEKVIDGLPFELSGRNTQEVPGGKGLLPFDTIRKKMRECAAYMGVPCWPAPIVLNMIEAMMSGAPIAFYDNQRGIKDEALFDGDVGCCSHDISALRSFCNLCLRTKSFREDQSAKSLQRAKEFFEFKQQAEKWRVLFSQMEQLWK